ncbi:MAG: glycosyltransferase family 39 protein [bacterium]|nr:glycosyltransferase family 39 protein [bacterium]
MARLSLFSPWPIVILLAAFSFVLMLGPAASDSAIMDELAHIPAGYGYMKYQDYRLNPEHPPLVKMFAGFPLVFQGLNFPTDQTSWITDINGQWIAGSQFLYESGNNADNILFWARLGPMLLTLGLIILVYIVAREILGRWWALLPAFFTALSPNILAHGHYVTTDIGAAFGILLSTYLFLKYLNRPGGKSLVWAGLGFGLAQLMKFSAVLLIPYFLGIFFIFWLINRRHRKFWKSLLDIFLIFIIGTALIYIVYLFAVWNYPAEKQVTDTEAITQSFGARPLADLNIWMAGNKFLRPLGQYLLGVLMVMQRSAGGNTGYFLGEVSAAGWWYYFPAVFVMKEPLAILITMALALVLSSLNILRSFKNGIRNAWQKFLEYAKTSFSEMAMFLFAVMYWAYSMNSNLNIGFRHLIPTLPFMYILVASAIKKWFAINPASLAVNWWEKLSNLLGRLVNFSVKFVLMGALMLWLLISSLFNYPYYLSSFNEFFGGVNNGYQYVADSNYDWGQDLKRLKIWAEQNLQPDKKIAVDYFGGGHPQYYLGNQAEYWSSSRNNPKDESINWLAVSINTIQSAVSPTLPGFIRNPIDEYRWLENPLIPFAKAGTSIFIYKL